MLVADLITRAVDILQDTTNVRWPAAELIRYLNDGQRQIVLNVPDASITNSTLALAAGTKQTLPSGGIRLIDVVRNVSGNAIRIIDRDILDTQIPGWHNETAAATKHYIFDPRDPTHFYVYPPATSASPQVEIIYSSSPSDAVSGGSITLADVYANALLDYVLYRAYSKDAEYAGDSGRAAAAYSSFLQSLGNKVQVDAAVDPNAASPPKFGKAV